MVGDGVEETGIRSVQTPQLLRQWIRMNATLSAFEHKPAVAQLAQMTGESRSEQSLMPPGAVDGRAVDGRVVDGAAVGPNVGAGFGTGVGGAMNGADVHSPQLLWQFAAMYSGLVTHWPFPTQSAQIESG